MFGVSVYKRESRAMSATVIVTGIARSFSLRTHYDVCLMCFIERSTGNAGRAHNGQEER